MPPAKPPAKLPAKSPAPVQSIPYGERRSARALELDTRTQRCFDALREHLHLTGNSKRAAITASAAPAR